MRVSPDASTEVSQGDTVKEGVNYPHPAASRVLNLVQQLVHGPANCSSVVDAFLRQELRNSITPAHKQQINAAFSSPGVKILLVSTHQSICMFDNFLVHANKSDPGAKIVHVSLDKPAHDFCSSQKQYERIQLLCLDLSSWLPVWLDPDQPSTNRSGHDSLSQLRRPAKSKSARHSLHQSASQMDGPSVNETTDGNAGFGSCIYQLYTWAKPVVLLHAVEATPGGVLMMDSDIILRGKFEDYCSHQLQAGSHLLAGTDADMANTGTVFATNKSVSLVSAWVDQARFGDEKGDQAGLHRLMSVNNSFQVQLIPTTVVGMCGNPASMATHFNCVFQGKINNMKLRGVWHPVSAACNGTAEAVALSRP